MIFLSFLPFIAIAVLIPMIVFAMVGGKDNPFTLFFIKVNTCRKLPSKYFSFVVVISVALKAIFGNQSTEHLVSLALVALIPLYVGKMFLEGKTIHLHMAHLEPDAHILRVFTFVLSLVVFACIIIT